MSHTEKKSSTPEQARLVDAANRKSQRIVNACINRARIFRVHHFLVLGVEFSTSSGVIFMRPDYDLQMIACGFLWDLCKVAGVDDFHDLPGKIVRLLLEDNCPVAVGHAIEDVWFQPTEAIKAHLHDAAAVQSLLERIDDLEHELEIAKRCSTEGAE